eukprot:gene2525-7221_t
MLLASSKPKGTLDGVVGDRGRVVFNAARACGGHRAVAANAALQASSVRGEDGEVVSRKVDGLAMFARGAFGA